MRSRLVYGMMKTTIYKRNLTLYSAKKNSCGVRNLESFGSKVGTGILPFSMHRRLFDVREIKLLHFRMIKATGLRIRMKLKIWFLKSLSNPDGGAFPCCYFAWQISDSG
ncbi:hypothetical protein V2J09_004785 [Rumex salicifolius]